MPKKSKPTKCRPFYKSKPPKPKGRAGSPSRSHGKSNFDRRDAEIAPYHPISPAHFKLRDDGQIQVGRAVPCAPSHESRPAAGSGVPALPKMIFTSDNPLLRLYHGNCLELLDAIYAKYGDAGRFDAIFADPPYFLSNGGITCHAGRMVKVDKGDWDVSRGPELNHEFNIEWLRRCQRVLKPNGTIWVTGTHHVIFSIGYAMQQLGYKILNDIAWEKPNPPPNLSCRYFTHSTETILWAAKNEKSKHVFNYQEMRKVTGKQMKTVWRKDEFSEGRVTRDPNQTGESGTRITRPSDDDLNSVWTLSAPGNAEKEHGKHPTQKPVALVERCLSASTNEGDLVLDPFLGGGTTAIAALHIKRGCVGIELNFAHLTLAAKRADRETVLIWLRNFRVRIEIFVMATSYLGRDGVSPSQIRWGRQHADPPSKNDLDLFPDSINGSRSMDDKPQVLTERIFHECKFVFLSCAQVECGAVVHTTVDVSLQEAWAKTPNGKKRETTHVVRCETEIFRVKSS